MRPSATRTGIAVPLRRAGLLALAGLSISLLLAGCANRPETSFDQDSEADMTQYRTFAWIKAESLIPPGEGEARTSPFLSPIDDQRIRRAVAEVLTGKGYLAVDDPEAADLIVSYSIGSQEKIKVNGAWGGTYGGYYGYPGTAGGIGYGYSPTVQQYTEGTLAIEFWDRAAKQAVWVGWASQRLWRKKDRENYRVGEAVVALLEPFPPHPSSLPAGDAPDA